MKTLIKTAGAASLLALAASSASVSAEPLPFLTFQQNAGWSDQNSEFNGAVIGLTGLDFDNATAPPAPANTFQDVSWSSTVNGGTSSINITSFDSNSSPTALTDGNGLWEQNEFWIIDQLLQTNNVLGFSGGSVPNPLWKADTLANLFIFDNAGIETNPALREDLNSKTTIEFWETRNNRANDQGICPSPNPLLTDCDDVYRISAITLAPIDFELDGYKYTIDFGLEPGPSTPGDLVSLVCFGFETEGPCSTVDVTPGQIWVFTPEDNPGTSSLFVTMAWSAKLIPEPSVLALFGIGILGAGFASRRRKQA